MSKIEELLKALGLPVALAAVIASVAGLLALPLDHAVQLFGILTGVPFVVALVIDLLKLLGVVNDGTAGKWSAGMNLVFIIGLAVLLRFIPAFDVAGWDAKILEVAKAIVLIVTFILQLFGTKGAHQFYVNGLGAKRFSFS